MDDLGVRDAIAGLVSTMYDSRTAQESRTLYALVKLHTPRTDSL